MNLKKWNSNVVVLIVSGLVVGCSACGDEEAGSDTIRAEVVSSYAELAEVNYRESVDAAKALNHKLKDLIQRPSNDSLNEAKQAWLAAREPYLQTEVFRFYEGPIDNEVDGPEGLLNAWPMDEHFLDYTVDEPEAGLINDLRFEITAENIVSENENGGEKNIATGFHAIEFLLWGQDNVDGEGAGERPYTDYVVGEGGTANNQDRRAKYLELIGDLLVLHLEQVHAQWKEDGKYRTEFVSAAPDSSIEKILTGMIVLAGFETGGERLQAALDSGDKEDEHSCFSDNTHRDMIQDVQGISNVYHGTYTTQLGESWIGKGLQEVVLAVDPDLAAKLELQIKESLQSANALQIPFENEIKPGNEAGNARVQDLISRLRITEKTLERLFEKMGFSVPAPE